MNHTKKNFIDILIKFKYSTGLYYTSNSEKNHKHKREYQNINIATPSKSCSVSIKFSTFSHRISTHSRPICTKPKLTDPSDDFNTSNAPPKKKQKPPKPHQFNTPTHTHTLRTCAKFARPCFMNELLDVCKNAPMCTVRRCACRSVIVVCVFTQCCVSGITRRSHVI